ncbi:MAG: hypothetical protein KY475_00365, partial [Planctomycetes bacterium]|nr:hypothetical protein [Planctomycetota bacterium]
PLAPLTRLQQLDLFRLPLGPHGALRLKGLPSLEKLELNAENLGDDDLPIFATMPELTWLELFNAPITNKGLEGLAHDKLSYLSLGGCLNVTDAGLGALRGLTNLRTLDLSESGVVGRDLTPLAQIPTLEKVELTAAQFKGGQAAIDELKEKLPSCEVVLIRG